jgi:hypothetical protein
MESVQLEKLSTPPWSFKSVRASRVWCDELGDYVTVDPYDRVHVWVFALQTAVDAGLYDPLNLEQ